MSIPELLYQLQKLDDKKKKLEEELEDEDFINNRAGITAEIERLDEKIAKEEEELEKLQEELDELEFSNSRLTRDEENYQEQLYNGETTNPKELNQIQEKLSKTQKQKEEIEEETLDLMMKIEDKEKKIDELIVKRDEQEEELERLKEEHQIEVKEIKEALKEIPQEKEAIKEELSSAEIEKYNKLYDLKQGQAVAKLKDNYCLGCRMTLPVKFIKRVKQTEEVITCDNCGRILYYED